MIARQYEHVFLSPHLDDAVFSAGGEIAMAVRSGLEVLVVTVCAGIPAADTEVSPMVRAVLDRTGETLPAYVERRREEDRRAMRRLGADFRWLPELDAVYRHPSAYGGGGLLGEPVPEDALLEWIASTVRELAPEALLHAPLAVGGHVDHRIVHRAARESGRSVVYYEDFPYCAQSPDAVERRLQEVGGRAEARLTDVEAVLEARIEAALAYESQVGDAPRIAEFIRAHARALGDGRAVERSWTLA